MRIKILDLNKKIILSKIRITKIPFPLSFSLIKTQKYTKAPKLAKSFKIKTKDLTKFYIFLGASQEAILQSLHLTNN